MIDLRSDTVTKPTAPMIEAMMTATVGDDVFDEDPTVLALQEKIAAIFGMEAALYCPSGTMTNQIAIRVNTQPQDEVICDQKSHIYLYEGGGIASNSLISVKLLAGERGILTPDLIGEAINPDDIHFPHSSLVSLENTMNKGGGCYYTLEQIAAISEVCQQHQLKLHLDGARVFNALTETGENPVAYGKYFDTISVCFSKGLGAPVGSALLGSTAAIKQAKRVRKAFGGGMRQAGYLAAACIYALDHHRDRLKEDHDKAVRLGQVLGELPMADEVMPVETNIVIVRLREGFTPDGVLNKLKDHGILGVPFGKKDIRFVTHLDYTDEQLNQSIDILTAMSW
ncbi:MAG: GntG family PLP-dependent aldolase [Cyclobacteriaceae bacterium]